MSVVYVAYKSFLGNWFKLEGQSKFSSDHKRPVLVTITSVKTRLSCDINFVMKCFCRRPRPLWALSGVFIQINTLLKPHIGHALLDLRLFWSKKFRKFSRVYKRKRHFLLFCFVSFCFFYELLRNGPLEITGGGVIIPSPHPPEEATCIAFKVTKSIAYPEKGLNINNA